MRLAFSILLTLCNFFQLFTQVIESPKKFAEAIEDNSFLIEESYNQENRVVQHISNLVYRTNPTKDFVYTFTQEWPVFNYRHQLSYTIPFSFLDGNSVRGLGDIFINYRYQVFYKDNWACFSPRLSIILPAGDQTKDLGNGVPGFQVNLPVSKRLTDFWVIHVNAGYTLIPSKKITIENVDVKKSISYYNIGGSAIWLTGPNFNLMLECTGNFMRNTDARGIIQHTSEIVVNPGFRAAINPGNLQIVPGFSLPLVISNNEIHPWALFYLSFEHPF